MKKHLQSAFLLTNRIRPVHNRMISFRPPSLHDRKHCRESFPPGSNGADGRIRNWNTRRFLTAFSCLMLLVGVLPCTAQESEMPQKKEGEHEAFHPHHNISLVIGHAQVREGVTEGRNRWLGLPSWGIDYNFVFHPRWSIGLHTDIIPEKFLVEKHLGEEGTKVIERQIPIAPAITAVYALDRRRHWGLLFGAGAEFSTGESFFLSRIGVEYGFELPKHWELMGVLSYDIKWDAYDSVIIGLGIAKAFGLPHKQED